MTDDAWSRAVAGAQEIVDKDELKSELSLRRICELELGVNFVDGAADCPFHGDRTDSRNLTIFGDPGDQRIACWVCTWRGDVFDVIGSARGISFSEAIKVARRYHESGEAEVDPDEVRLSARSVVTHDTWTTVINAARGNAYVDPAPIARFLHEKALKVPTSWLLEEWRVGCRPGSGTIVVPYYDRNDQAIGYKERTANTPFVAAKGARLTDFYGAWRFTYFDSVVICEGETDTWTVQWVMRGEDIEVLGVPTGAATRPSEHLLELLIGRTVTLAFDADVSGRTATERWLSAIPDAHVLQLPDGMDCSKVNPAIIREGVKIR